MQVKHRLTMLAKCPVNDGRDEYAVTVETDRVVKVEDILAAVADYADKAAFQEDITRELARRLGVKVTTVGMHGTVETTVMASEPPR